MEPVIAVAAVILALVIGFKVLGLAMGLFKAVVVGLIVGAIARALLPGAQKLSWLHTMAYGLAGSLLGGVVARYVLHMHGFFLTFCVEVAVAALLIGGMQKALPKP